MKMEHLIVPEQFYIMCPPEQVRKITTTGLWVSPQHFLFLLMEDYRSVVRRQQILIRHYKNKCLPIRD
jgi:hypothetical protein